MKRTSLSTVVLLLLAGCTDGGLVGPDSMTELAAVSESKAEGASTAKSHAAEYDVTIVNMSHSQPFSPGVVVVHDGSANLFTAGMAASEGIRLIAENGDPSTALAALDGAPGVADVVNTGAPVHRKGGPGPDVLTTRVSASDGADYLSLAVMLICTNDGFVGLDSVPLPKGPETAVYFPNAYDAGTEYNDELGTSIVDPCGAIGPVALPADGANNRTATSDNVEVHPGIAGVGDLDATAHSWRNKIARVTVKRVR